MAQMAYRFTAMICGKSRGEYLLATEGGSSVMLWGCITFYSDGSLVFFDGNHDSKRYIDSLDVSLLPVTADMFGG